MDWVTFLFFNGYTTMVVLGTNLHVLTLQREVIYTYITVGERKGLSTLARMRRGETFIDITVGNRKSNTGGEFVLLP